MLPGQSQAKYVQDKIRQAGIQDVQLFWDKQIKIWVMCQVQKHGGILLPDTYKEDDIRPHIMFYIKDNEGKFRIPNERDVVDVIAIVGRAQTSFQKPQGWLADQLDEQDHKKYQAGREKLTKRIKDVGPTLKRAVRKELG